MGWKDPYGSKYSDMLWAWIPCALAFTLCPLTESIFPFQRKPLFYMWFWKLVLPFGGLFIHEWFVPQGSFTGIGVVEAPKVWGVLLMALVYGTHFSYWTYE